MFHCKIVEILPVKIYLIIIEINLLAKIKLMKNIFNKKDNVDKE